MSCEIDIGNPYQVIFNEESEGEWKRAIFVYGEEVETIELDKVKRSVIEPVDQRSICIDGDYQATVIKTKYGICNKKSGTYEGPIDKVYDDDETYSIPDYFFVNLRFVNQSHTTIFDDSCSQIPLNCPRTADSVAEILFLDESGVRIWKDGSRGFDNKPIKVHPGLSVCYDALPLLTEEPDYVAYCANHKNGTFVPVSQEIYADNLGKAFDLARQMKRDNYDELRVIVSNTTITNCQVTEGSLSSTITYKLSDAPEITGVTTPIILAIVLPVAALILFGLVMVCILVPRMSETKKQKQGVTYSALKGY